MSKLEKISEVDKSRNNTLIQWSVGLLAVSLIVFQDIISSGISDVPEHISLIAFCIALPILAGTAFLRKWENESEYWDNTNPKWYKFSYICSFTGFVCSIIGINAAIYHASWIAGLVFLLITLFATFIYFYVAPDADEVEQLKDKQAKEEKRKYD